MWILIKNLAGLCIFSHEKLQIQLCPAEVPQSIFPDFVPMEFQTLANLTRRELALCLRQALSSWGAFVFKHGGTVEDFTLLIKYILRPKTQQMSCHVEKIGCVFKATCVLIWHSSTMWLLKALLFSLSSIRGLPFGQSLIISQWH